MYKRKIKFQNEIIYNNTSIFFKSLTKIFVFTLIFFELKVVKFDLSYQVTIHLSKKIMKKIFVSTVCFLVVLISCRQQEDVSLSQEDLVNIKLIQKNRNYRKINNITNIKTDTVYRTLTLDMGTGELDVISEVDPNKPPKPQ